jgi:hypothetical protein
MQQNYKKFQKVAILLWNGKTHKKNIFSHEAVESLGKYKGLAQKRN